MLRFEAELLPDALTNMIESDTVSLIPWPPQKSHPSIYTTEFFSWVSSNNELRHDGLTAI